jgi:hypothetical protein
VLILSFLIQEQKKGEELQHITKKNGVIALKKHVDANHAMLAKNIEEEINFPLKDVLEKKPAKKKPNVFSFETSKFFGAKDHFKTNVMTQFFFWQDLALLVVKNHLEEREDIVNLEKPLLKKDEDICCQQTQESGERRWAIIIEKR